MKTFVIGDIHGRWSALIEVLAKSKFRKDEDKLIVLGDIVDGGSDAYSVIEELIQIKNTVLILGNHDLWFMNHISSGWSEEIWLSQGGKETIASYKDRTIPITHQEFLNKGKFYHIENNMLFVHGGFDPNKGIEKTSKHDLVWDRSLIQRARNGRTIKPYDKVFVGHTTTQSLGGNPLVEDCMSPIKFQNLIMMDCGAGWSGKLAIMNVRTEEYWMSRLQDPVRTNALTDDSYQKFLKDVLK